MPSRERNLMWCFLGQAISFPTFIGPIGLARRHLLFNGFTISWAGGQLPPMEATFVYLIYQFHQAIGNRPSYFPYATFLYKNYHLEVPFFNLFYIWPHAIVWYSKLAMLLYWRWSPMGIQSIRLPVATGWEWQTGKDGVSRQRPSGMTSWLWLLTRQCLVSTSWQLTVSLQWPEGYVGPDTNWLLDSTDDWRRKNQPRNGLPSLILGEVQLDVK